MFCWGAIFISTAGILEGRRLLFQALVPPGAEGALALTMEGAGYKQLLNE